MTATDWRTHDTSEAREAFYTAQERLDDGGGQDGQPYTLEQRDADEKVADRYDRLVLQPAHCEFERRCDEDEFRRHFPEPADGSRIEWAGDGGTVYGAYRQDNPDEAGGVWWLYGSDHGWSWRALVWEYRINMVDLTLLVSKEDGG